MQEISKYIELNFPVRGDTLPSDHGYPLYAAISDTIPAVHNATWLGIHSIKGRRTGERVIELTRGARLRLRLPLEHAPLVSALAGKTLEITGHQVCLGVPTFNVIKPAKRLRSRLVMIKCKGSEGKSAEEETFKMSLEKQVKDLGISAQILLERNEFPNGAHGSLARRVLRVKSAVLTGYGVILDNLSETDSILIQEVGLGGKRRMGCGLFDPLRGD